MDDCVFCNIINKTIEAKPVFENDDLIVINDLLPKAPVHVLIIPKKHIKSVAHLVPADQELMGKLILTAKQIAEQAGVADSGYRLTINVGRDGGMVVPHLHLHLLGGKQLGE